MWSEISDEIECIIELRALLIDERLELSSAHNQKSRIRLYMRDHFFWNLIFLGFWLNRQTKNIFFFRKTLSFRKGKNVHMNCLPIRRTCSVLKGYRTASDMTARRSTSTMSRVSLALRNTMKFQWLTMVIIMNLTVCWNLFSAIVFSRLNQYRWSHPRVDFYHESHDRTRKKSINDSIWATW